MRRVVLGAVLGGMVAFGWGAVSWMVLPWHHESLRTFTNEVAVARTVQANAPAAGVYLLLPAHWQKPTKEQQAIPKGLMFFGAVRQELPDMSWYYLRGLAIEMLGAFLIGVVLLMAPLEDYWGRVKVVTLVGLAAGVLVRLPDWNWWGFSTRFTLLAILDLVIAWFLAGLVIAKLVRRP